MNEQLIEIIFKHISPDNIGMLLKELTFSGKKIKTFNFTCEFVDINWSSEKSIGEFFLKNKDFGLFLNLTDLTKENFSIPNCGIVVYKDDKHINVEVNFKLSEIKINAIDDLVGCLMGISRSIAVRYHISNYFCGIESAEDTKMRLFTNEHFGPFSLMPKDE